jgi:hypothetical protein
VSSRFQNRRAKEKRLNPDATRRWSTMARTNERQNNRMKANKHRTSTITHDDDMSNDGDTAISYDGKPLTIYHRH